MKIANISTIKNELSRYLRMVKRGETIRVMDRDEPVADIVPIRFTGAGEQAALSSLEAAEMLRRGKGELSREFFQFQGSKENAGVLQALLRTRDEDR